MPPQPLNRGRNNFRMLEISALSSKMFGYYSKTNKTKSNTKYCNNHNHVCLLPP